MNYILVPGNHSHFLLFFGDVTAVIFDGTVSLFPGLNFFKGGPLRSELYGIFLKKRRSEAVMVT